MLARALVIAVVVALAAADHVSLAPGYDYDFQLSNNVVKGQLTLNRTCWAGIGVSSAMNMANASVFLIGSLNSTSSTPMVGLYDVANVPYGHAPPVLRADQSAVWGTAITYSAGYTYVTFSSSLTELTTASTLIWAFCDTDHTMSLTFHGDNHA